MRFEDYYKIMNMYTGEIKPFTTEYAAMIYIKKNKDWRGIGY